MLKAGAYVNGDRIRPRQPPHYGRHNNSHAKSDIHASENVVYYAIRQLREMAEDDERHYAITHIIGECCRHCERHWLLADDGLVMPLRHYHYDGCHREG